MDIATMETIEAQVQRVLANLERRWEVLNAFHDGVITESEMDEVLATLALEERSLRLEGAMKESSEGRSVSLYPTDWATLQSIGKDFGLSSVSGAIRYVLRDWVRLKRKEEARRQRLQVIEAYGAGKVTDEEAAEALLFLGMDLDGGDGDSSTPLGMTE